MTWSRILATAILASAPEVCVAPAASRAVDKCDRVLCYFAGPDSAVQWRIYDPVRRTDTLFLMLPGSASVRWDTSLTRVEYLAGYELFQADWKLGARPRRVARLPELPSVDDWWFNPDSLSWQLYRMSPLPEGPTRPPYRDCRAELWQSSRDGTDWHLVVADTESCYDWYYDPEFRPSFGPDPSAASRIRRIRTVSSDDLTHSLSPESDGAELIGYSSPECEHPVYYVPSRTIPQRGVLFPYLFGAPEPSRTLYPVHLVDREHGTRVLLCGPDISCPEHISGTSVSEECGLVLVVCDPHLARLVDIASGLDVALVGNSIGRRMDQLDLAIQPFWGPPMRR